MRDRSQDFFYALLLVGGVVVGALAAEYGPIVVLIVSGVISVALGVVGIVRLADFLEGRNEEQP